MATVFMKWLETSPEDYDRGIRWLTLGRVHRIKDTIAKNYIHTGIRVLEIGCGTGTLTQMMAQRGAIVTGIDASPRMLAEAEKKVKDANLEERVSLKYMDAAMIGDRFPAASFDLIVSTLVFSELPLDDQRFVLEACQKLLAPNGRLLIADEVIPAKSITRLFFYLVRLPLVLLTWLITRTTTHSLREFDAMLTQTGFHTEKVASYLGGSLVLYESFPTQARRLEPGLPPAVIGVLRHRVTLRTL
ncbi:MAG: corrinoid protein-associated methyltransferase CpaM, partial [Anaerolineae bacterium]